MWFVRAFFLPKRQVVQPASTPSPHLRIDAMLLTPDRARTFVCGFYQTLELAELSGVVVLDGSDLGEFFLRFHTFLLRRPHRLRSPLAQPSDVVVIVLLHSVR